MKSAHLSRLLRDSPAVSPFWRRGEKPLLIRRYATRPRHLLAGVPIKDTTLFPSAELEIELVATTV